MGQESEQLPGQMSIFDLMTGAVDINDMSEEAMVEEVSKRMGKRFERRDFDCWNHIGHDYQCKMQGILLTIDGFSTYDTGDEWDGKRMILVGFDDKKNNAGGGGPMNSIDEVVEYFKYVLLRAKGGRDEE